jgi:hypothetical protein
MALSGRSHEKIFLKVPLHRRDFFKQNVMSNLIYAVSKIFIRIRSASENFLSILFSLV